MAKLTEKQKRFCDYYIENPNGVEAYRKAGYKGTEASLRAAASMLLAKEHIKEYIGKRMSEKEDERVASQDEILEFLTQVIRGEVTEQTPIYLKDSFDILDKTPSIKDRTKAAELLGKRYAIFTEKQQVDITAQVIIKDDLDDDE